MTASLDFFVSLDTNCSSRRHAPEFVSTRTSAVGPRQHHRTNGGAERAASSGSVAESMSLLSVDPDIRVPTPRGVGRLRWTCGTVAPPRPTGPYFALRTFDGPPMNDQAVPHPNRMLRPHAACPGGAPSTEGMAKRGPPLTFCHRVRTATHPTSPRGFGMRLRDSRKAPVDRP